MTTNKTIQLATARGPVDLQLQKVQGNMLQVNALMPPVGPGFFLLFPKSKRNQALAAAKKLIEGEPLADNINITDQVPGAIVAGTVPRPTVQFGVPKVEHKAPEQTAGGLQ